MRQRILWRSALALALSAVLGIGAVSVAHPAQAQTVNVTIKNFAFNPTPLTVTVGTTVTWTNQDSAPHTATSDTGAWTTPTLQQGQSGSVTFTQPGTFTYHCTVHPNMKASIVVQSATTAGSVSTPIPLKATHVPAARVLAKEVHNKYIFSPARITVKVGQIVMWKNTTDAGHTVTSSTRGWTYNQQLGQGKSLTWSFKKAGTFHYKCIYHPGMVGTIVVTH